MRQGVCRTGAAAAVHADARARPPHAQKRSTHVICPCPAATTTAPTTAPEPAAVAVAAAFARGGEGLPLSHVLRDTSQHNGCRRRSAHHLPHRTPHTAHRTPHTPQNTHANEGRKTDGNAVARLTHTTHTHLGPQGGGRGIAGLGYVPPQPRPRFQRRPPALHATTTTAAATATAATTAARGTRRRRFPQTSYFLLGGLGEGSGVPAEGIKHHCLAPEVL